MNQPKAYHEYIEFKNAKLFTIICLPDNNGKFPTVIMRSPYVDSDELLNEEEICQKHLKANESWLENGYAVVFQHCRGRGKSSGDPIPYINEREDGLTLQDFVRKQSFYNGEIYLSGGSYTSAVHYATAPFADDIKGAVLQVMDTERYNLTYRNGFYKMGNFGRWFVDNFKVKNKLIREFTDESYNLLPLSEFTKTYFGKKIEYFDELLKHPNKNDVFWNTRYGGGEVRNALMNANIPVLLVTGFYDFFIGGMFDMWKALDIATKSKCAFAIHPFDHGCNDLGQPIDFENGYIGKEFNDYSINWCNAIRKNEKPPFEQGKVTYYKLFDNNWYCDDFAEVDNFKRIDLGEGEKTYEYNPDYPATFKGGLSANLWGCAWQDEPNLRDDIISVFTPVFEQDTFIKGKIKARLKVKSNCEDTCFYMRISLCKEEGYYGLRDDINQISNFCDDYIPNSEIEMDFSFDEHAFVAKKGEKLRIDISSSAFPHYVRHTNNKGLFSEQKTTKIAANTIILDKSYIEIPISKQT